MTNYRDQNNNINYISIGSLQTFTFYSIKQDAGASQLGYHVGAWEPDNTFANKKITHHKENEDFIINGLYCFLAYRLKTDNTLFFLYFFMTFMVNCFLTKVLKT